MNPRTIRQLGVVLALTLATVAFVLVPAVEADPVPITNPGFEDFPLFGSNTFSTHIAIHESGEVLTGDPIPGWELVGLGGTLQPAADLFPDFANRQQVCFDNVRLDATPQ